MANVMPLSHTACLSSLSADTCSFNHSFFQPLVLGPRGGAQKTREMAEGAGAPPTGTKRHTRGAVTLCHSMHSIASLLGTPS